MTCRGCKYWRPLASGKDGYRACHYMFDTKHMRGCDPDQCDKKESGKKKASGGAVRLRREDDINVQVY